MAEDESNNFGPTSRPNRWAQIIARGAGRCDFD